MTIQELYDWAKENDCTDKIISKHCNGEFYDIETVTYLGDIEFFRDFSVDKVILD